MHLLGTFQVFPNCYVLMTHKTTECYVDVLNYIENNVLKLEPREFITDFEGGMRKAIEICYPAAVLRGCWFHFCAALRKKAIELGLKAILKCNAEARLIRSMLMCLPLLPAESILDGYDYIIERAKNGKLLSKFSKLFKYFHSYWLKQVWTNTPQNTQITGKNLYFAFVERKTYTVCIWIEHENYCFSGVSQRYARPHCSKSSTFLQIYGSFEAT